SVVEAQRANILQVHPYKLGDTDRFDGNSEFDPMGMYNNLEENLPYTAKVNDLGVAHKTISDALINKSFDADKTSAMNLPEGTRGAAFVDNDGKHTYVIWAITELDRSEVAEATIDLSHLLGKATLEGRRWEYSRNKTKLAIDPSQIELTGSPLILFEEEKEDNEVEYTTDLFRVFPNPFVDEITVEIQLKERKEVKVDISNRLGQPITTVVQTALEAGRHQYSIDTSTWSEGIYYMQVYSEGENSAPIWTQLVKVLD
ncbi:MAG: T9SS type A sorting domain-containing protein, partial [Bacteroidota bacterium]